MTHLTTTEATAALTEVGADHDRATFLRRLALLTGGTYGAAALSPAVRAAFAQSSDATEGTDEEKTDIIVLNFALVLEYLEATFYERGLEQVSGLSSDAKKLVEVLAEDESKHVDALEQTVEKLGGTKAQRPKFDFSSAYADEETFLKTANTLEDTGVSAYNGSAPLLTLDEVKAAAGSIVQVEARHAALIRLLRDEDPAPRAFDVSSKQADVLTAIKPFIVEG